MSDNRFDAMEAGAPVSGVFLLKEKSLAQSKVGKKYLTLTLSDHRGDIEGKLWDEADVIDTQLERMMPVHIEGVVTVYRERPQITVRTIRVLPWNEELAARLVPASRFELGDLLTGLDRILATITDPNLKALAETMRRDEELMTRFAAVPAAKIMHHAYMRGLLEHSLSMMQLAAFAADHYGRMFPGLVDRDLLLVGTMLHDVGKVREYRFERGIDLTTEGRLVGHLVLGVEILDRLLARVPDFPVELESRLKHLIVSHHGEAEKGAPVNPITLEALILHLVDYMDSQVNGAAMLLLQAGEDEYSAWSNKFERRFLNQRSDLSPSPTAAPSLGAPPSAARAEETGTPKPAQPPAAKPVETPAAKPVETPAAKPVETPAAKPVETPAAKPVETPAAKPKPAATGQAAKRREAVPGKAPSAKPEAEASEKPSQAPPPDSDDGFPFEAAAPAAESDDLKREPPGAEAGPEKEATAPYPDEEPTQPPVETKPPKKSRGPGLPGL